MVANSLLRTPERQAEIDARKVVFLDAVTQWVASRRDDERMDRDQIASLDSLGRLQAQRQSLLDNMAHFYAAHPNADVATGVLTLVTIFSDNNTGACSLSIPRLAAFLSRSPRRVSDAIARLEENQLIVVERVVGGTSRIFPWVHRSFGSTKDALTWILDVRAPAPQRGMVGRPSLRNTPDAGVAPISDTPDAADKIPLTLVTNTPDTGDVIPLTPASPNTTIKDTTVSRLVGPGHFSIVDEQDAEAFNALFNTWGSDTGHGATASRDQTDALLAGVLRAHASDVPEHVRNACIAALADASVTDAKAKGGKAFLSWFRKALEGRVQDQRISNAELKAKALTAQHVAEQRHARATAPAGRRDGNRIEATRKAVFGGES